MSATDRGLTEYLTVIYALNLDPRNARLPSLRRAERGRLPLLQEVRIHAPADQSRASTAPAADRAAGGRSQGRGSRSGATTAPALATAVLPRIARRVPAHGRRDRADAPASLGQVLHPMPDGHLAIGGVLPGVPAAAVPVKRTGRRGRRNATMLRIAHERISVLFALAGSEAKTGQYDLSDRYVWLARRIGTRYNVRLPQEYRELYCRGCSAYWVEGRTVRTRLRQGRRIRACLRCGRLRRAPIRPGHPRRSVPDGVDLDRESGDETAEVTVGGEDDEEQSGGGGAEEE
jgi:ribonuclease P protein subunit RPR2